MMRLSPECKLSLQNSAAIEALEPRWLSLFTSIKKRQPINGYLLVSTLSNESGGNSADLAVNLPGFTPPFVDVFRLSFFGLFHVVLLDPVPFGG